MSFHTNRLFVAMLSIAYQLVWNPHYVSHGNTFVRIQKKFPICMFYQFRSTMPCIRSTANTEVRTFQGLDLLRKRHWNNVDLKFLYKIVRYVIDTPDSLSCISLSTPQLYEQDPPTIFQSQDLVQISDTCLMSTIWWDHLKHISYLQIYIVCTFLVTQKILRR